MHGTADSPNLWSRMRQYTAQKWCSTNRSFDVIIRHSEPPYKHYNHCTADYQWLCWRSANLEEPQYLGSGALCTDLARRGRAAGDATGAATRDGATWEQAPWLTFQDRRVETGYRLHLAGEQVPLLQSAGNAIDDPRGNTCGQHAAIHVAA